MSDSSDNPQAAPAAGAGSKAPDLGASLRQVGDAAKEGLRETGRAAAAFRALVAADVSLARSAFGRTLALTGVAIVFGASCWLLLMAALIVFLSSTVGLPWSASLLITALLSGGIAFWAAWLADRYFDHTRMRATRRQLARLGVGEMADMMPDSDSPASARDFQPQASNGKPPVGKDGVEVSPS